MSEKNISIGSKVTMHFTIKLTDNTVAETTKKGDPSVFTMTEESLGDPVESQLVGKKAGDKVRVELTPEQGYGEVDESNIYQFPKEQFSKDVEPKIGDIFAFEKPSGEEVPGVITAVGDDQIKVDFNHPLAGKNLLIELEIVAVN